MTLRPTDWNSIPEETVRVAKAAFPKGNAYIKLRDELQTIYTDEEFADLFPNVGQFAESPGRLALITVLQFAEGLSDRQAAEAVRSRIDWKYMLGLELTDPGFDYSVLSEFRSRLLAGKAQDRLLGTLLEVFRRHKLLRERGNQRTDSTHIEAAIRRMNRLEKVGETLRAALNDLATVAPDWLRERAPAEWYMRYGERIEGYHLPKKEKEQEEMAIQIGKDGYQLLTWVFEEGSLELRQEKSVKILHRVWLQEYYQDDENNISLRKPGNVPPSEIRIDTPYDPEARYSEKRDIDWVGYKLHWTETCDADAPHLIIHTETGPATQNDFEVIPTIHKDLAENNLLPETHIVDTGYMNIRQVVSAKNQYGIITIGHPMPDSTWQAKQGQGFTQTNFSIDWDNHVVTCPLQHKSRHWRESTDPQGNPVIRVQFSRRDCFPCSARDQCTRSKSNGRGITLRPQIEHETLQKLRRDVHTQEFKAKYRRRAGIEGTLSQAVRAKDVRHARYIGLAKVHLQNIATAAAINLARVFAWLSNIPPALTRVSPFSALAAVG